MGVSFVRRAAEPEGVLQPRNRGYGRFVDERYDEEAAVEQVAIGGPYAVEGPGDTPSRREIFVCRPAPDAGADEEQACAGRILGKLARRAYRRPVDGRDVAPLLDFFRSGRRDGGFDDGVQFALERMLVDPEFLFRIERDPVDAAPGLPYLLGDLDLASRLSFFLWSSIPDDELLEAAADGRLSDPAGLERQTRRLLADARSRALVDNFASQWLRLRNLESQERESAEYPEFDENLRAAFRRETELFVESTIREDRSPPRAAERELHVRQRTAGASLRHPRGLRRPLPAGDARPRSSARRPARSRRPPDGDLLSQPDVAGGAREVAARDHPGGAAARAAAERAGAAGPRRGGPAGVGPRAARAASRQPGLRGVSCADGSPRLRPRELRRHRHLARHQRDRPADRLVGDDAQRRGVRGTGGPAAGAVEPGRGVRRAVTEKLLAYALGRGLEYPDRPAVRRILRDAAADDYRWSSIVLGIVKSTPFQWRRSRSDEPALVAGGLAPDGR